MASEVVCTQLVVWIYTFFFQIRGPFRQVWHVFFRELPVPLRPAQRRDHQQQITTLLYRHLVLFVHLAAAIDLSICKRIGTKIVRSKGEAPSWERRIPHQWLELCLQKFR